MKIGIIIPTHNRKKLLESLLVSIQQLKIPANVVIETIVVVDGSTDGTFEKLEEQFRDVHIVKGEGNWWWTKSINKGLEKALELCMTHALLLNDDNLVKEDYLEKLLFAKTSLPENSIIGSASISMQDSITIDTAGYKKFNRLLGKLYPYKHRFAKVDDDFKGVHCSEALSGRGTLIPIKVIEQLGRFDERLIQYGSDDDFTMACKKSGYPVYISWDARVYNYTKLTSRERNIQTITIIDLVKSFFSDYSGLSLKKEYIFYSKHSYPILAPLYCTYLFVAGILLHLKRKIA